MKDSLTLTLSQGEREQKTYFSPKGRGNKRPTSLPRGEGKRPDPLPRGEEICSVLFLHNFRGVDCFLGCWGSDYVNGFGSFDDGDGGFRAVEDDNHGLGMRNVARQFR